MAPRHRRGPFLIEEIVCFGLGLGLGLGIA